MNKIKQIFNKLNPGQKKLVVYLMLIGTFVLIVWFSWEMKQKNKVTNARENTRSDLVDPVLEPELIELSKLREQRVQMENLRQELANLKERPATERVIIIKDKKQIPGVQVTVKGDTVVKDLVGAGKSSLIPDANSLVPIPPPAYPAIPRSSHVSAPKVPSNTGGVGKPGPPVEEYVGGIGVTSNHFAPSIESKIKGKKGKKKEEENVVFLPPSFMEATLLTGFDASTAGGKGASGGSEPVMLRIQAPAILPNYVKAELGGCFIIAEARGNLAKERAEIRLNTLSCVGRDGKSVINEKIKGFVVDGRDGKNSLAGRVVSKMGAATARALLAGIFEGVGEAFTAASSTQSISALGTTQVVDNDELTRGAIGGGISKASSQLSELYMDLARQTSPVIEVLPAQKVTVVISEGVELKIKTYNKVGGQNYDNI